jgi:hypothetical protein
VPSISIDKSGLGLEVFSHLDRLSFAGRLLDPTEFVSDSPIRRLKWAEFIAHDSYNDFCLATVYFAEQSGTDMFDFPYIIILHITALE